MTLEFHPYYALFFFVLVILPIIMLWANVNDSNNKDTRYQNLSQKERDELSGS